MALGSGIIELALGMIFFYFSLSIISSQIVELISGLRDWRGQELAKGIRDMLNNPQAEGTEEPLPATMFDGSASVLSDTRSHDRLGDCLMLHPMIGALYTTSFLPRIGKRQAAYIPDTTFSRVLVDILAGAQRADLSRLDPEIAARQALKAVRETIATLPPGPRQALEPLVDSTVKDIHEARRNIEHWYNTKMDRVSGVYKRWTQLVLLLLALAISVALNADSIVVATVLWQNPTLRTAIADQAAQVAAAQPSAPPSPAASPDPYTRTSQQIQAVQRDVQNVLIFPIGWGQTCNYNQTTRQAIALAVDGTPVRNQPNCRPQVAPFDLWAWLSKLAGILITGLAVSLGAPFWFDLLRKVSNLRSSGPAPDEKSSAMPERVIATERTAGS